MPVELNLLEGEKLGSIIIILGYILLIVSAQQGQQTLISEGPGAVNTNQNTPPNTPTPASLAATASWIRVFGLIILTMIAQIRLNERQRNLEAGTESGSIAPNIKITLGEWIAVFGFILASIGTQERADEQARITVL